MIRRACLLLRRFWQRVNARRQALNDQGLCVACGRRPAEPGHETCQDCYEMGIG